MLFLRGKGVVDGTPRHTGVLVVPTSQQSDQSQSSVSWQCGDAGNPPSPASLSIDHTHCCQIRSSFLSGMPHPVWLIHLPEHLL